MSKHLPRRRWFPSSAIASTALFFALVLTGCGGPQEAAKSHAPVPIAKGDECHVCGMIIANYPGPKGEAYTRGSNAPFKFCSTRDLFGYLLQPESAAQVQEVYVHDMGSTPWDHPADSTFTDARTAWYVVDQPLQGAMGPTLAPFKERKDAEAFVKKHGGKILRFKDITLKVLADLGGNDMGHMRH